MTDLNINADLQIDDGGVSRTLTVADLTGALPAGAATSAAQATAQTTLASILTELGQKLEAGDLSGLATQTTLASVLSSVDGLEALLAHLTDGTQQVLFTPPSAAAVTQVSSSASSVTLKAANANRRGLSIMNDSTAVLYVKFGATASTSSYTVKLLAGDYFELPIPYYRGVVDGIWASANGSALITELS